MQQSRIATLNKHGFDGSSVVYIMSRDQRVQDNHALAAAQLLAIEHEVPLYVFFNLRVIENRSREHYDFMLAGLQEVAESLQKLDIPFVMRSGDAVPNILDFAKEVHAGALIFDMNPLHGPRAIARTVAKQFDGLVQLVDTHNVIPLWVASDKKEFAAHTMRGKVHKYLENYLREPVQVAKHKTPAGTMPASMTFAEASEYVHEHIEAAGISVDTKPGEAAAHEFLQKFLDERLESYALLRNDIANDQQSGLSPYLHYGQLSSLRVALEVIKKTDRRPLLFEEVKLASHGEAPSIYDGMNALLEEMIVRKELADNFCWYAEDYLSLKAGPDWAQKSLAVHAGDPREHIYTREQWEAAQTHDFSWNAAQNQLRKTGKIHGYMRMYWAKKMLEWSESPEVGFQDCIYLNDKYSIDGGDPNGYVGILWSFIGLHDRPWFERPVFGKIRYMNEGGLMRKYDVKKYHADWNS